MVRGDESDRIVNKRNGLQRANMVRYETEMESPSSTWILEDVDRTLEALEIIYSSHGTDVEGLAD